MSLPALGRGAVLAAAVAACGGGRQDERAAEVPVAQLTATPAPPRIAPETHANTNDPASAALARARHARDVANAIVMPRFSPPATKDRLLAYQKRLVQWFDPKNAAFMAAESAYREAFAMTPDGPARVTIARECLDLQAALVDDAVMALSVVPYEFRDGPPNLYESYRSGSCEGVRRIIRAALETQQQCLDAAATWHVTNDDAVRCGSWAPKKDCDDVP